MPEPIPYLHCVCGSTSFRVPLEHISREYVIECATCHLAVDLPYQMTADYSCPLLSHRRD